MPAPVVALVGRPNVGKSTLFNQLTRTRDALVADQPGLTRDRQYGIARWEGHHCVIVDTGGLIDQAEGLDAAVYQQAEQAIAEADVALFMVDARSGLTAADERAAEALRAYRDKTVLVVNKAEGLDLAIAAVEFYQLGFGDPVCIAAAHRQGLDDVRDVIDERVEYESMDSHADADRDVMRVAFVGRPNAGKSTLVNRLLGEERLVASDVPGTTRDSVEVDFEHEGQPFVLVDTAGLRRRSRVHEMVEKFSAIKTIQSIEAANVVVAMVDAQEGLGAHDTRILGMVADAGRALVLAINKWDGLESEKRDWIKREIDRKLPFLEYATVVTISALHGSGLRELMKAVKQAHASAMADLPTSALTDVLTRAVELHAPPAVAGRRIKLRFAHQGGRNPPKIVIHGNRTDKVSDTYKRYLINVFRDAFDLRGTPIALQFRTGDNPFEGRKNPLTERQQRKRQRMIRHAKKKKR